MYKIIVFKSFEKDFNKIPEHLKERVIDKLELLREDPYSKQSKKLINREGWRIRIGDYRIIYDVSDKLKEIYPRKISHRKDIYK